MNFANVDEDDPYHIFNSCASTATESVGSFINNIISPPESVYYAAEYIRLQSEIDNWKEKATNLETQLKGKEIGNGETQTISKETEFQLQEKFNLERIKVVDFYETGIKLLREQNSELERSNSEHLKNIEFLTERLNVADINISEIRTENSSLQANLEAKVTEIEKLTISENKLKKTVKYLLSQVVLLEGEPNTHMNEMHKKPFESRKGLSSKKRTLSVRDRARCSNQNFDVNSSQLDNSTETSSTKTLANDEHVEEDNSVYQPFSSPVTPVAAEDQERLSVITQGSDVIASNNVLQSTSRTSSSSLENRKHFDVFSALSHHLDLQIYMCSCGRKYNVKGSLRNHINQMKNAKVYRCQICKVSFLLHKNLKVHYKKRHGLEYQYGKYGCGCCGRTFPNGRILRQHKILEHCRAM